MLSKSIRGLLVLLITVGLASCSSFPPISKAQVSPEQAFLLERDTSASAFVTGSIFAQPIDPNGKLFLSSWLDPNGSDFDQYVWDNFTLQSNETITQINWYGGYDPLKNGIGGPVVDFTVAIYSSIAAGTEPAVANPPLITYQTGGSAGETTIGQVNGIPMYAYTFSLPTSFVASAGVKYWMHIKAFQHGSSPDWGLSSGTGGDGNHYRWGSGSGGDSGYRSVPGDVAFTLLGLVPNSLTDIFLSNDTVDENQLVDTVIGSLSASDSDPNATFTFSLTCINPGVDDSWFNISGTNLQTSTSFDFETKNAFDLCIRVTDQGGLTLDKNFIVTVNDINEAPTMISISNLTVTENQPINTVIGELTAVDPDLGATFTFSLTCAVAGVDDQSFNISGTSLQISTSFDFETQNMFDVCIRVTDQGGLTLDNNFIVTVNDVNEIPTSVSLSNTVVNENQPINTVIGILTATDPDAGTTFTFSLTCAIVGADDSSFNTLGTNLRTSETFTFAKKSTYYLCVRVTDQGGLSFDRNFVVTVNNLNEAPTDIFLSNTVVAENQIVNTVVSVLTATDPDAGAIFTFSLTCTAAGADDSSFNILGTNLRTSSMFDFETKSVYNICLRVTDQSGLTFDKNFIITVNNLNEVPMDISLPSNSVDENRPINTVVGILTASDPDVGTIFTFSLTCAVPGINDTSFSIGGINLLTSTIFDYETKPSYTICVRVTDQSGLFFDKNFVVTVNNLIENTVPTDITLSSTIIDENQPINTVVGALGAKDPDAGAMFTFSLKCVVPGADDGSFNILGTNLQTSAVFDYEIKSTYAICVRVTDQGGLFLDKNFTVSVNDVNEVSNTPGTVTGGGNIDLSSGKANFGFVVQYDAGNSSPSGNLTYQDHKNNLRLKAISFDLLVIDGNHAWFTGVGMIDGGRMVTFTIEVSATGQSNTFYIYIPSLNGYEAGGALTGGNVTIHK